MGKRSSFERRDNDFYPTPAAAVGPLISHLRRERIVTFAEPCCGDGTLIRHLESYGLVCRYRGDRANGHDALEIENFSETVITNPPWERTDMHRLISHFLRTADVTWLLFDAAWAHTKQSRKLILSCTHILPIGRLKWIPGSRDVGKDDVAWYRFQRGHTAGPLHLPFRSEIGAPESRRCHQCGAPFRPQRVTGQYCSDVCRQRAHRASVSVTVA